MFSVNRTLLISVFSGDEVGEARLVSGAPGTEFPDSAVFPATEGVEYHIGVAAPSGYFAGTEFVLSWAPGMREEPGNDDFAEAITVVDNMAEMSLDFDALTVEHGEPAESGVRTAWYTWQPTAGGRYTWNVEHPLSFSPPLGDAVLQTSVFKGTELATLEPVAVNAGDRTDMRMAFDAEMDASYAFALGLPRDAAQMSLAPVDLSMQLGETPVNDDLANAILLTGMSGSITGSNEFATNEPGEFTGALGDSSLWWTIEPEEGGWLRFAATGEDGIKLAIYRMGANGSLELVATSRGLLEGETTLSFNAEAGVRYILRLGSYIFDADGFGGRDRGEFELSWGPAGPPARLAFVEVIVNGDMDDEGTAIELEGLTAQAFNADGTELYVASELGIVVFARDTESGKLTHRQTLADHPIEDPGIQLLWDEAGSALLVASCDGWARFTPVEGGGIEYGGEVTGGPCPTQPLMMSGSFVHDASPFMIETYQFNDDHTELSSVEQVMIDFLSAAAMKADGSHVYAVAGTSLMAFERDDETGMLSMVSTIREGSTVGDDDTMVEGVAGAEGLAVHNSHLFVSSGRSGAETAIFDLADAGNPAFVAKVGQVVPFAPFFGTCAIAVARHDVAAVDAACSPSNYAYTVQAGAGSAFPSDLISLSGFGTDAFGEQLPDNDIVYSLVGSPDGRHLYIAGLYEDFQFFPTFEFIEESQMVVFERRTGD